MATLRSHLLCPLQLSPQGLVTGHSEPPYYAPHFWCTSRAVCFGPDSTVLVVFPKNQPILSFTTMGDPPSNTDVTWTLQLYGFQRTLLFPRHTGFEQMVTHPQLKSRWILVPTILMDHVRQNHAAFLTPPVPHLLDYD